MSALERVNQILRYDFAKGFTRSRGEVMPCRRRRSKLPHNKGLEALVMVPKGMPLAGTLIAISERGLDAERQPDRVPDRRPDARAVRAFAAPMNSISATRCCCLRRSSDAGAEIFLARRRRHPHPAASHFPSLAPGAVVDGPAIFDADLGHEIDNMEGIDAHVTPEGDTVLTMVSDDNFSLIQRTLLLQFTLVE